MAQTNKLVEIELDRSSIKKWAPQVEHEREVAIFDLLESNSFKLVDGFDGPYKLVLGLRDNNLVFSVSGTSGTGETEFKLSAKPLKRIIKDYFMICENYFQAIKGATSHRIQTLDMTRRAMHDEGAAMLGDALAKQILTDTDTKRRLFTLVCVLHVR